MLGKTSATSIEPNTAMCSYVEVGNAGYAKALESPFESFIPAGVTNIDINTISCVVVE